MENRGKGEGEAAGMPFSVAKFVVDRLYNSPRPVLFVPRTHFGF